MAVPQQSTDQTEFWTRPGLAAWFNVSERTIEKYIEWKLVPPALGKHPNGFNYDSTHVAAIAAIRAEMTNRIPLRERRRRPHVMIRAPRQEQVA